MAAIERLPVSANDVRTFLLQPGALITNQLLRRLGRMASDPKHPLHGAALAMVQPLADEGVDPAQWVILQARSAH